jgi:hypothetical protein
VDNKNNSHHHLPEEDSLHRLSYSDYHLQESDHQKDQSHVILTDPLVFHFRQQLGIKNNKEKKERERDERRTDGDQFLLRGGYA